MLQNKYPTCSEYPEIVTEMYQSCGATIKNKNCHAYAYDVRDSSMHNSIVFCSDFMEFRIIECQIQLHCQCGCSGKNHKYTIITINLSGTII